MSKRARLVTSDPVWAPESGVYVVAGHHHVDDYSGDADSSSETLGIYKKKRKSS